MRLLSARTQFLIISSFGSGVSHRYDKPSISMVKYLYIYGLPSQLQDDTENMQWLEILHPFTSAKNLYLSCTFVVALCPARTRQGKSDRCITCPGVFFWRISSRRNLSREPLSSLLLRDSSQVAQRPKSPNRITGSSLGLPFPLVLDYVGSLMLETSLLTCYKQDSKNT